MSSLASFVQATRQHLLALSPLPEAAVGAESLRCSLPAAASCEADATKLCADSDPNDPGAVLACLREYKPDLSEACSDEIFKTEQEVTHAGHLHALTDRLPGGLL